ncbi:hypothetical protein P4W15_14990 [Morganella morganii]|nr:hypothetical protein [Morganella morganii]
MTRLNKRLQQRVTFRCCDYAIFGKKGCHPQGITDSVMIGYQYEMAIG